MVSLSKQWALTKSWSVTFKSILTLVLRTWIAAARFSARIQHEWPLVQVPIASLFNPESSWAQIYGLHFCWHSRLLNSSQDDPLTSAYSKTLSGSQLQMLPENHFRRPKNHMVSFLTTTPLLRTMCLSFFHCCDQILDKRQLSKGLFKGTWSITANMAASRQARSMELTRGAVDGESHRSAGFILSAFWFSPGS